LSEVSYRIFQSKHLSSLVKSIIQRIIDAFDWILIYLDGFLDSGSENFVPFLKTTATLILKLEALLQNRLIVLLLDLFRRD
jgi:hypothetical protein